jgi:hypothetical protein
VNEGDHKRKLAAEINNLRGGYARRYEDLYAVGMLDLMIKLPDLPPVWVEAKIIRGNSFGPTLRQWVEGDRMIAAGLRVLLIGWKGSTIYISPWVKQADRRQCEGGLKDVEALQIYLRRGNP